MFRDFLYSGLAAAGTAFLLHYAWEALHAPLYTNYGSLGGPLPLALYATLGDVFYTLFAVAVVALYRRDGGWIIRARGVDYAALALFGFCISVFVEYKALFLERWEYAPAMPLLFGIGLSPILQMAVLLPLSVFLARLLLRFFKK